MKIFKTILIILILLISIFGSLVTYSFYLSSKNEEAVIEAKSLNIALLNTDIETINYNYETKQIEFILKNSVLEKDKQYKLNIQFNNEELQTEKYNEDSKRVSEYFSWNETARSIVAKNIKLPQKIENVNYQLLIVDKKSAVSSSGEPVKPIVQKESELTKINLCEYQLVFNEFTLLTDSRFPEKILNQKINILNTTELTQKVIKEQELKKLQQEILELEKSVEKLDLNSKVQKEQKEVVDNKIMELKIKEKDLNLILGVEAEKTRSRTC